MFGFLKRKKKQDSQPQDERKRDEVGLGDAKDESAEREPALSPVVKEAPVEEQAEPAPRPSEPDGEPGPEKPEIEPEVEPEPKKPEIEPEPEQPEIEPAPEPPEVEPEPEKPEVEPDKTPEVEPEPAQPEVEPEIEPAPQTPEIEPERPPEVAPEPSAPEVEPAPSAPEIEPGPSAPSPSPQDKPVAAREEKKEEKKGFFARIKSGLGKTRANLTDGLADLFLGKKQIDDELLEDLETQLLMADVGIEATTAIIERLQARVSRKELNDPAALYKGLQEELGRMLEPVAKPLDFDKQGDGPFVILVVGVNGVGKTTTIGKLTQRFQREGKSVMLAAGDTFRAAAVEQLKVWGERNDVPVIAQHTGADSASVIYDAVSAARARGVDVLIADTAGRLHNKSHLMEELKKVHRVMQKIDASAPHEVMLVLDAGTGQNAISQASTFNEAVPISGITLTKLDGTAKGGVIFALAKQLETPIRFIGVGESLDDLRPFSANDFVNALFDQPEGATRG
ncbi:signal recognition particle-docking protein FtsY [Halomonas sp. GD1P12]|uniref:signal recognition particle-docking protein FtsY n=1 Tax=Halomonas sp. GD1P12 TaxID=2982691 RepID=UPI0021E3A98D|nr:signal recognition particle-docking protein FtsY [Halomonas sp. GD1P12]UYF99466.1 signal recognition particle-docking protein FtsY [Halomonas sp. GD1P12]